MDFALITGDQADNMQRNETLWTRALLEGGSVDPNSGSQNPLDWSPLMHPSCAAYTPTPANLAEAAKYTGVQDFDDYNPGPNPYFYDPDDVQGTWAQQGWPSYPGLMDRAQLPFTAAGLSVPSYVTNGNHDGLVQGNQSGNAAFEDIATGCFKALGSTSSPVPGTPPDGLDPSVLLTPSAGMLVPPDPQRRFVDKKQIKQIYGENGMDDAHGYDFVDEDEDINSAGGASYYAWDPPEAPGMRFISIDTLSEGGIVGQSSDGNIDDPQFQWLERELEFASGSDKVIVVFGHHPIRSLNSNVPDEAAGPCGGVTHTHGDVPEHDLSPGCDIDPRASTPIHYGEPGQRPPGSSDETLSELLDRFPHVVAYIAGHTHENRVQPFTRSGGGCVVGHRDLGHRRLARAAPAGRADGQQGRHAVDLRHDPRRGGIRLRAGARIRGRVRRGDARLGRARVRLQRPAGRPRLGRREHHRSERRAARQGPAQGRPRGGQVRFARSGQRGGDAHLHA